MKYYLQILLILFPTILLSAEWEKVDLPNLNNGKILNVYLIDSIYVVEKQGENVIVSIDLKEWVSLDSSKFKKRISDKLFFKFIPEAKEYIKKIEYENAWSVYNESGLLYYNKESNAIFHEIYKDNEFKENLRFDVESTRTKFVKSKDNRLHFLLDDNIITIDDLDVSKLKIDMLILEESFVIAFRKDSILYVKSLNHYGNSEKEKYYKSERDTIIRIDSNELSEELKLNFQLVDDIKSNETKLGVELKSLNYTYIHYFWVKNNILSTKPADYWAMTYIDLESMQIFDFPQLEENYNLKSESERIGDYYFYIINNWKDSATIEIYDSSFNEIKEISFKYQDTHNNSCYIEGFFDDFVIIESGAERLKLDLKTLEYEKLFSAPSTICQFSEEMIIMSGPYFNPESNTYLMDTSEQSNHRAIFSYSFDTGKSWIKDTINGRVSDRNFNTCARGENSHSLDLVGKTIYSFTKDTIFMAEIGQKQFESLLFVEYEYHLKHNGKIYFLDYNTDIIYILTESGNYTKLKCPVNKVVNFCFDNSYLYVANSEEIYRLKLE
ncbi:MAG: hypothetical protein WC121_11460 [Candidatus Kapaibacterium sp.]